jgi:hypothetical protein
MDNEQLVDPSTRDRIITEAVRRGRRRQRRWRLMGAGGVLVAAVGATAIGLILAGGPSTQQVTTVNPAVAPTTIRAGASPGSAVSPPATPASLPMAPCRAGQLRISVTPYDYGMGEAAAQITYQNTSTKGCTLEGYPGITVSNRSSTVSISAHPTTPGRYLENQNLGSYPPAPVAIKLPSGARAVSYIGWGGGDSLPPNKLSQCVTGPWIESITLPHNGGVSVIDGNLGSGVCTSLQAEPIQPATYQPAP